MSEAGTPTASEAPAAAAPPSPLPELDERDAEPRTPMKRLGSTRKHAAFNNIRAQLGEQSRLLEARAEAAAGVAGELHEYCRRRAELEHEYARALDKLARAAALRHREHRARRELWPLAGGGAFACWQAALDGARALARDHAALAGLYGGPLAARLQRAADDVLRLHRKCRDIVAERHEEVSGALAEAAAAGKAHAAAAADWRHAAVKLRHAYDQREKLAAADTPRHKKLKALDKELEKRRARHSAARGRALRTRADYVLSLEAANATLQRYYLDDIADVMLCSEVGLEAVVGRVCRTAGAAERARGAALAGAAGALLAAADALDAAADRQRFMDAHRDAFAPPRPLRATAGVGPGAAETEGADGAAADRLEDEMRELVGDAAEPEDEASAAAAAELLQRLAQLDAAARALRAQARELAKTLDAAEEELVKQIDGGDSAWDVSRLFGSGASESVTTHAQSPDDAAEASRREQEDYYLAKFRSYASVAGRLARLESKASAVRTRLSRAGAGGAGAGGASGSPPSPVSPPRRAAARARRGRFAAPLGEHLAAARAELPPVLTACVRVIDSYGLHHQGLFRVSGSHVEMAALRAAFERGEDPLADVRDASDMHSVCGLLKLYLRELRPPLVPPPLAERLARLAALPDDAEFITRMRELLRRHLPRDHLLVLRYLFAFLAHLAAHSDRNMMDAWNLAICVGPTLVAAGGGAAASAGAGAQVTAQNLVNELVKRTIEHHAAVFPQDVAPHALYRPHPYVGASGEDEPSAAAEAPAAPGPKPAPAAGVPSPPPLAAEPYEPDEPDAADDLSLYDDDDDDEDVSEDGESGDSRDGASGGEDKDGSLGDGDAAEGLAPRGAGAGAGAGPRPPPRRPPTRPTRSRTTATRSRSGRRGPSPRSRGRRAGAWAWARGRARARVRRRGRAAAPCRRATRRAWPPSSPSSLSRAAA